jgi:hypothetical protein
MHCTNLLSSSPKSSVTDFWLFFLAILSHIMWLHMILPFFEIYENYMWELHAYLAVGYNKHCTAPSLNVFQDVLCRNITVNLEKGLGISLVGLNQFFTITSKYHCTSVHHHILLGGSDKYIQNWEWMTWLNNTSSVGNFFGYGDEPLGSITRDFPNHLDNSEMAKEDTVPH